MWENSPVVFWGLIGALVVILDFLENTRDRYLKLSNRIALGSSISPFVFSPISSLMQSLSS